MTINPTTAEARPRAARLRAITWRRALGVSFAGNLASIATSILVPLAVVWVGKW